MEIEGEAKDDEKDILDDFEALIIESESESPPMEPMTNQNFITELGLIDPPTAMHMMSSLLEQSAKHMLLSGSKGPEMTGGTDLSVFTVENRYSATEFHGIMIDTGAAGKSMQTHHS
jgi:hypothetical protein